ncbi:ATP-grasp domain-containing protein [bacterium]|nr:ATP-grasp domain-containing protein [bacterium]
MRLKNIEGKKLAILGASEYQLPLIQRANELGLETHVYGIGNIEAGKSIAFKFYPISVTDSEAILRQCSDLKIDGICSIGSDIVMDSWMAIAEALELPGNRPSADRRLRDKFRMLEALNNVVECPDFQVISNKNDRINISFPLVVRPLDSWGSQGVQLLQSHTELNDYLGEKTDEVYVLSEFIEGEEYSVEMISYEGQHFPIALTKKVCSDLPYFVELEHHLPSGLNPTFEKQVYGEVTKALDVLGHTHGASHSEVRIKENHIYFMEVAGRMGGDFIGSHLIPAHTGYDYVEAVIGISLGYFEPPKIELGPKTGIYFLPHPNPQIQTMMNEANNYPEVQVRNYFDPNFQNTNLRSSRDRIGYFIYLK